MSTTEVKILSDTGDSMRVGGYGVVWGGKDLVGDSFSPSTDLWLDKLSATPPVLFDHGQDDMLKRAVVGRVETTRVDDVGLWIEAKLSTHRKYIDAVRRLVKEGALGWSSGAVGHLVERTPAKQLTSWAIAEFSLTSTPMEPRTLGVRTLKSLASIEPSLEPYVEDDDLEDARVDETKAEQGMARSDYAWVDSSGTGHLDISDEGHVRAAMARFNQTHFTEDGAKRSAARKIIARARSMGIDVSPDSAVAMAAKGVNMADLPDEAFAYTEPGGTLDDERKTFPRALRHFQHHDETGELDTVLLDLAVAEAKASPHGEHALAHLLAHARGEQDAHSKFWTEDSFAGELTVVVSALSDLADEIVTAQKAMEHLGYEHSPQRVRPEPLQAIKELRDRLSVAIERAEQAESGDDGTQRAKALRYELELLEV